MTNWERIRARSYEGRYLFCSTRLFGEAEWAWLRAFRAEAKEHGAEVEVSDGHVYVVQSDGGLA